MNRTFTSCQPVAPIAGMEGQVGTTRSNLQNPGFQVFKTLDGLELYVIFQIDQA